MLSRKEVVHEPDFLVLTIARPLVLRDKYVTQVSCSSQPLLAVVIHLMCEPALKDLDLQHIDTQ